MLVHFIIILSRSQQFPTSSSQNQVELGEWATGYFMHWVAIVIIIVTIIIFYHYFYYHIIFMMCRFNEYAGFTGSSCPAGVVQLLLPGLFTCQPACAPHRAMLTTACRWHVHSAENEFRWHEWRSTRECWSCWSIRSGKYSWCSDQSLRGKNMHSVKARFVLLICKLSPRVVTL